VSTVVVIVVVVVVVVVALHEYCAQNRYLQPSGSV
jgi:hypothetical protein